MLLHTVNKSPATSDALASCLRSAASGSRLLLLEDGVYAAVRGSASMERIGAQSDLPCYALAGDVAARGLQDLIDERIALVDYNTFVRLSVECHGVQSWY